MNIKADFRPTIAHLILIVVCLFTLTCTLYLYARHESSTHSTTAYCTDCLHYAMSVDAKIRHAEEGGAENIRTNKQFFRYAVDVTCRGGLFVDKRCLDFRRGFLGDAERYMVAVGEPYEACRGIGACR
ncbi:hypothetical protein LV164_006371 [Aspergillus fumigatus]|nr:hypothetical protein KXX42_001533 [Aspergillus fumigatus]KAH1547979.1 hypothetical protein KXX57_002118 [Aspergillus fumigatus]KAH1977477.1 hypothetical protein KXW88_008392 [Aspergillus fumigatus]KAH2303365.1 hypothetical protein KXV47_000558 [Aspergillus fumigatus]KAH2658309.1 hypothetical protein KXV32_001746 [Aspergillus fumigatus]